MAACRDWRKLPEDQNAWEDFKTHFKADYQHYKDDAKQVNTSSHKANQLLQDTTTQVLNQIKGEAFKEEENIKDMHLEKNYLMCQTVRYDYKVTDFKASMKDLQRLANKLASSFEPNKSELSKRKS